MQSGLLKTLPLIVITILQPIQPMTAQYIPAPHDPVKLAAHSSLDLPYLITADGQLLASNANGEWIAFGPQSAVQDVYVENGGRVWTASNDGLMVYENGLWRSIDDHPAWRLESTHGYLFSMGPEGAMRLQQGREINLDHRRAIDAPLADAPIHDLVMLGSHTHVLHIGDQVFQTLDVGLTWRPLDAPEPVIMIGTDTVGDLLAVTEHGIQRWREDGWGDFLPLPSDQPITEFRIFHDQLYALSGGSIYLQVGSGWEQQTLPDSAESYFTALAVQFPDKLWALDSRGARLWSTTDAVNWTSIPISQA